MIYTMFLIILLAFLFGYRNNLTYSVRTDIMYKWPLGLNREIHGAMPSYEAMTLHPKYWKYWTKKSWFKYAEDVSFTLGG